MTEAHRALLDEARRLLDDEREALAWSLALAGGPIQGGRVVGATTPDGMESIP